MTHLSNILYHNFIKPFNDKYKIKLDYPAKTAGTGFRLRGRGFAREVKHNEPNFGNYVISEKQLARGHICLRYPSGTRVKSYPDVFVSPEFQKMICDIIYDKKFDESDYHNLDDSEKRLFDEIVRTSRATKDTNLQLYKLKKITDKEKNEDIKKFKILSGEVISGNDNLQIIKDLKKLTIKLYNEGLINRAGYNKVLEAIFAVQ